MKIIFSSAKKMNRDMDSLSAEGMPVFLEQAEKIIAWLRTKSYTELKALWECQDKIGEQNFNRLKQMNLQEQLTPAVLSYEGIAYQYMAPSVFENSHFHYIQEHLRILSAVYGVLKPMDGVVPYRLEMQAKAAINGSRNLYDLWGSRLYEEVMDDSRIMVNLASKEYSKCVEKYLKKTDIYITCTFAEKARGKLVTKGTYAKMARGEMVRFMAENQIEDPEEIKNFNRLRYSFREELSSEREYVFVREQAEEVKGKFNDGKSDRSF